MERIRLTTVFTFVASLLALATGSWIQIPGFAEITQPQAQTNLAGLTTIRGTASHPDFESYEISFAYDPNPQGTWFPITDRVRSPVQDDRLGLWDTGAISRGVYQVRLTVHPSAGEPLFTTVGGLRIGELGEPTSGEFAAAEEGRRERSERGDSDAVPSAESKPADEPVLPETILIRLIGSGALASIVALAAVAIYMLLRPRIRQYLGHLRMRRIHSRRQRERRPPRS